MFLFRRRRVEGGTRLRALRELYRDFADEAGPEARGRRLLREWLSPEQLDQFDAKGYFEVVGSQTGKRYRIYTGSVSNVHELNGAGEPALGWCFLPERALVAGDVMLAQKIALETDEPAVLEIAIKFTPKAPPPVPQMRRR